MKITDSNRKQLAPLRIYAVITLAATAIAIVLRTLSLCLFFEADIGYYAQGAWFPTFTHILMALFVAGFAAALFALWKKKQPPLAAPATGSRVAAWLCVLLWGAYTVFLILCKSGALATPSTPPLYWLAILLSLATILFFAGYALQKGNASLCLVTGLAAILWFLWTLGVSYFDATVAMNAPHKTILHLACLSGMLLMLSLTRESCRARKNRLYLFSLSCGVFFLMTSAIPSLIYDFIHPDFVRTAAPADFVCLALGVFAIVRLCELTVVLPDDTYDIVEETPDTPADENTATTDDGDETADAPENDGDETADRPGENTPEN